MNRREALEFVKKQASAHATYLRGMSAYVDDEVEQDSIEVANDIDEALSILSQEPEDDAIAKARADTYEECAQIAEDKTPYSYSPGNFMYGQSIAACIRQRAKEKVGK